MIVLERLLCRECGLCSGVCPTLAIALRGWGLEIDHEKCTSCGRCAAVCPAGALSFVNQPRPDGS